MTARRIRRGAVTCAAVAIVALGLAGTAFAGADLRVDHPAAWSAPITVRQSAGATAGSISDDSRIFGDATFYWNAQFSNIGNATAVPTLSNFQLDGVTAFDGSHGSLAPGGVIDLLNNPQFIRGGLHTLRFAVNPGGVIVEDSTSNDVYARQIHTSCANIAMGAIISRSSPPDALGGTDAVQGVIYPNQDGMRIVGGTAWEIVALRPPAGVDDDLNLYDDLLFTSSGFRTPLTSSLMGAGVTDFILNNPLTSGTSSREVGVRLYSGPTQNYSLEHREASPTVLASGSTYAGQTLAQDQMVSVYRFVQANSPPPRMLFELTTTAGVVLRLGLYNASASYAARSDAMASAATDAYGHAVLDLPVAFGAGQPYALVVYRDQADGGTAPATFTLRVRPTPADLSSAPLAGFDQPVNASNGASNWNTDPTALDGNTTNTNLSFYYSNPGAVSATGFRVDTRLDGQSLLAFTPAALAAGASSFPALGPLNVRGGRHTLSYVLDLDGSIDETYETNNAYARQFVWSPKVLTDGVTLLRALPPDPVGGIADLPVGVTGYYNSDGLRTDPAGPLHFDPVANVVAIIPTPGADVDLDAFDTSTGPFSGFQTPLTTSQRGAGLTDLITRIDDLGARAMDVGVRRFSGTNQSYVIENVFSNWIAANDPPVVGPDSIASAAIVKAYTISRGLHSTMAVVLDNLSGNADLGLSIYQYNVPGVHAIDATLANGFVDAVGPGVSEGTIVASQPGRQYYLIVVWKKGWSEFTKNAKFQLRIDPAIADVPLAIPHEVSFAIAGANPAPGATKLRFDLPAAAEVSLDVLDLQGRHVRSVASGTQAAGSHTVAFDGADDAGQPLRAGAYFVRFASGSVTRVQKLVVMR